MPATFTLVNHMVRFMSLTYAFFDGRTSLGRGPEFADVCMRAKRPAALQRGRSSRATQQRVGLAQELLGQFRIVERPSQASQMLIHRRLDLALVGQSHAHPRSLWTHLCVHADR